MPTAGTRAANIGIGDFGTSPIFVQLSDKPLLASVCYLGCGNEKHNARSKNSTGPIEVDSGK